MSHQSSETFGENAKTALADVQLRGALRHATSLFGKRRLEAARSLNNWEDLRTRARAIKDEVLLHLDRFLETFVANAERRGAVIGFTLLNMAVFGAMLSYVAQGVSFILLRRRHGDIARPFVSPLGISGAVATIVIAVATIAFQLAGDPAYRAGIVGVAVWFSVFVTYFALVGRHRLILSPEEEFAMERGRPA